METSFSNISRRDLLKASFAAAGAAMLFEPVSVQGTGSSGGRAERENLGERATALRFFERV